MAYFRRNVLSLVLAVATTLPSSIECSKVSSSLQVHIPKELSKKSGNYDHREALFGVPPYGGSVQQNVYHANDDLCDGPIDPSSFRAPGQAFILMVDRGHCTFVQKVRNAQHSGAAAVIIADNVCQCKHSKICTLEKGTECEQREPLMADDGSGADVTVPTMLMFKQDADKLKDVLSNGKPLRVEMSWSLPNPDDHVEYDLWSTVTDDKAVAFQRMWLAAQQALGDHAAFTPHYYIYDGIKANCRDKDGVNMCYTLCTNEGRYCAIDPDNDLDYGVSGANVVEESLRRLCIWSEYGNNGVGPELFQYVEQFEECNNEKKFTNAKCIGDALSNAGIDRGKVNKCMTKNGGVEKDDKNSVLQYQLDEIEENGIIVMPVAYVNGVPIRGTLDFDVVFKAVCAGFKDGTAPDICGKCADCTDAGVDTEYNCVVADYCAVKDVGGVSLSTFAGSLIGISLVFGIIAFIQNKRSQSHMHNQVKGIMAEYMPLDKQGLGGSDTAIEQDEDEKYIIS